MSEDELSPWRSQIDEANRMVLEGLARRQQAVGGIAVVKIRLGMAAHQPERQQQMIADVCAQAEVMGLDPEFIGVVFGFIHDHSVALQQQLSPDQTRTNGSS